MEARKCRFTKGFVNGRFLEFGMFQYAQCHVRKLSQHHNNTYLSALFVLETGNLQRHDGAGGV